MDWRRTISTGVLLGVAVALITGLFSALGTDRGPELGWDFRVAYLPAAEAVLEGASPYPLALDSVDVQRLYAYPPQLAFAVTPLTALSEDGAAVVAVLGSLVALIGAIALLGVRDVRCYAVVVAWLPGWNALQMANASAVLVLLVALAWRFRDALWPLAIALAAIVSLKLFLWPLFVWAAVARRLGAALLGVAIAVVVTVGAWAAIGFAGLSSYPDLLSRIASQDSYSITDLAQELGLGLAVSNALMLMVGASLLAVCIAFARRGDDESSFIVCLAAALALSPIVWLHYLTLLVVPLALRRPRFSALWLVPLVLWLCPRSENGDGLEPFLPTLVVAAVLTLVLVRPRVVRRLAEVT